MIVEDYVSFETAKLLKEKRFESDCCHTAYDCNGEFFWCGDYSKDRKGIMDAPTLQMAMKWLRETKNIQVVIGILNTIKKTWTFALFRDFDGLTQKFYSFKTYEEACEAAIKDCLENLI